MTMNPNSRISDLKISHDPALDRHSGIVNGLGSLLAAAFILTICFITRRFYE